MTAILICWGLGIIIPILAIALAVGVGIAWQNIRP